MNMSDPTSLENLRDIVPPHPIPWLPPAPGWYALGISILLLFGWFSVQKYLAWKRDKYRREAMIELDKLGEELADSASYQQILVQLPQLVKRTAMAAYGRNRVASLNGIDWLTFLNKTGSTDVFTEGDGKLLSDCSYQSTAKLAAFTREQVSRLYRAVYQWINKHQT